MELIESDEENKTVTIKFTRVELAEISLALTGLNQIYGPDDFVYVGVPQEGVRKLRDNLSKCIDKVVA